ncbi:MAG: hypothetical protein IJ501_02700 [Bacilli bacterium]|nr:hypothetical protein [Bacilli bacterium]
MKKLYLIKNPELFQGEKYLKKKKNYFEGWYFKNTNLKDGISFIPGISITKDKKKAFIQVITNNSSYYINYDIEEFKYSFNPFYIKLGNNFFSKDKILIDIKDDANNLIVSGNINYSNHINIKNNFLNPNIMGIFSFIPFMECNHAILSMQTTINGKININNQIIEFNNNKGYIEKDFGTSFPKSYIWLQGNNFLNSNASFMLSIANIPFKIFHFKGIICSLIIDEEEYRFATYNNTKIIEYDVNDKSLNITLKKGRYYLNINSNFNEGLKLIAPVKGKMSKDILESIKEEITIMLKKDNQIIFSDKSINCGLEIVLD